MFVVTLTYVADLSEIDGAMGDHVAYLERGYADGVFVASGRRVPRTGGVILAAGVDREALEARVAEDPFVARGLADVSVVEFTPSQTADGFEALKG